MFNDSAETFSLDESAGGRARKGRHWWTGHGWKTLIPVLSLSFSLLSFSDLYKKRSDSCYWLSTRILHVWGQEFSSSRDGYKKKKKDKTSQTRRKWRVNARCVETAFSQGLTWIQVGWINISACVLCSLRSSYRSNQTPCFIKIWLSFSVYNCIWLEWKDQSREIYFREMRNFLTVTANDRRNALTDRPSSTIDLSDGADRATAFVTPRVRPWYKVPWVRRTWLGVTQAKKVLQSNIWTYCQCC